MPSGTIIMPSGTIIMPSGTIWPDFLPKLASVARGCPRRPGRRHARIRDDRTSQDDRPSAGATPWRSRGAGSPGGADPGANLASFGKNSGQMVPDGIIMVPDGINALY